MTLAALPYLTLAMCAAVAVIAAVGTWVGLSD